MMRSYFRCTRLMTSRKVFYILHRMRGGNVNITPNIWNITKKKSIFAAENR